MTEKEIITSIHVTPGNKDDGKLLQTIVNKTIEQQLTIEKVLADTAYSGKDNLSFLQQEKITAYSLKPCSIWKIYSSMTKK
jgi:hypothetical protein